MRTRQNTALVLAFSVGLAIAVAQLVREMPAVGAAKAKVFGVSIQDIELTDDQDAQIEAIRKQYRPKNDNVRERDLTQQQKDRRMNIRQEFRPKIQEAGNRLRTSIREDVGKTAAILKPAGAVAERTEHVE